MNGYSRYARLAAQRGDMMSTQPPPAEPSRKDTRPWPVPIAPEELAAAIFRAADRQRDARMAQEASEPPAAD